MLFILTNSEDATASFLINALKEKAIPFVRLDTDRLVPKTSILYRPGNATIKLDDTWFAAEEVSHIWYRRPERLKDDRFKDSAEGKYILEEWTEFIEGFFAHIPKSRWINHPASNALASRKLEQLTTASSFGFKIPETLGTQEPDDLRAFFAKHRGHVITKPIASGYLERSGDEKDSLIYTSQVHEADLANLDDLTACPTLFQQFIQKRCDVRITIVDANIHAVAVHARESNGHQRCDVRRNNMTDVTYQLIDLPLDVKTSIEKLMEHYDLRFAAIDMAVADTGEWFFFEINPNGQWAWLDMCAGLNIAHSFVKSFSAKPTDRPQHEPAR